MSDLKNEIHDYWTNRARGYSEYNQQEMADARQTMWRAKLLDLLGKQFPEREPKEIKILDVGTGPGFFAILLAEAGYQVTAIDYTEEMLKEAQQNACGLEECIVWKTGDAQALDVENNSFDAIVTRNVTWNLPRPDLAYKEWLRVLKPGGMLYNFDADWYGHLYNEEKRNSYEKDRQQTEEQNVEDYYSGTDIEKMEEIARQVPLSRLERPKWDIETMQKTGFLDVFCDEEVWKEVWTEEEIINTMLRQFDQDVFEGIFKGQEAEWKDLLTRYGAYLTTEQGVQLRDIIKYASIIEREAGNVEEMPLIASVFYNRLNSAEYPYLQSCATVQYILKERKAVLSTADTQINSPYNTYLVKGLPAGPIASPGLAAIRAALYPEKSDYYFFVLGNDGKHIFSKTYEEHLLATQQNGVGQ